MENKKTLIIIIAVLGVLVIGLGGYLVYDEFISKDTEERAECDKKDNKNSDLTYEESEIISEAAVLMSDYMLDRLGSIEKKVDNLNTLDNQFKLELGLHWAMNNGYYVEWPEQDTYGYWAVGIKNYFDSAFGTDITYQNEKTFYCEAAGTGDDAHWHYLYDSKKEVYYDSGVGHGGFGISVIYSKLANFEYKDGKYILTYNFAFTVDSDIGTTGLVYDRYSNKGNLLFEVPESIMLGDNYLAIGAYIKSELNTGKYKLNEYVYTFAMDEQKGLQLVGYDFKEVK